MLFPCGFRRKHHARRCVRTRFKLARGRVTKRMGDNKVQKILPRDVRGGGSKITPAMRSNSDSASKKRQFTITDTELDGIPFAITTNVLAPVSMPEGTSKFVDTVLLPVATPIVLWSCVRA